MKKLNIIQCILSLILVLNISCSAPKSDKAITTEAKEVKENNTNGDTYKVNTETSTLEWIGTKVSGYHTGTVKIKSGELTLNDNTISGGNFIMDMTTIVATGPKNVNEEMNHKLTGHLRSADFFDVEKYPEATFTITSVKPFKGMIKEQDDPREETISKYKVNNPTNTVSGNLTIKGITKNIEFPAGIIIDENSVEATAKFNINRKQWDIIYPGKPDDLVKDEINLGIFLKATK